MGLAKTKRNDRQRHHGYRVAVGEQAMTLRNFRPFIAQFQQCLFQFAVGDGFIHGGQQLPGFVRPRTNSISTRWTTQKREGSRLVGRDGMEVAAALLDAIIDAVTDAMCVLSLEM
jgi:hypothetical protein